MHLGSDLRSMRKNAGLSQEDMALELHIARSTISKLETNQMDLKATDLIKWANVTQCQDIAAAIILGIDVGILQQALEIATSTVGLILGGF